MKNDGCDFMKKENSLDKLILLTGSEINQKIKEGEFTKEEVYSFLNKE